MPAQVIEIRRYDLVTVNGETLLACYSNGKWTVDKTCEHINQMLRMGIVREETIQGWVETKVVSKKGLQRS